MGKINYCWLRQIYLRENKSIGVSGNAMNGKKVANVDFGEAMYAKKNLSGSPAML